MTTRNFSFVQQFDGIRFIPLMDGKLILAESNDKNVDKGKLLTALRKMGITQGILNECLPLISREDILQIPVARAFYRDEPPKFDVHFGISEDDGFIETVLKGNTIQPIEPLFSVKKDQVLITIKRPFKTVLCFPDGRSIEKKELSFQNIHIFSGDNTRVTGKEIVSTINGSAFLSECGIVEVHPLLTVKGLGEIHGRVDDQVAVKVTQDVHSHSHVELPSNIFVDGMVHSSHIKVKGHVHALEGLDNTKQVDSSLIFAGRSVFTSFIKKYRVIAKGKIFVSEGIHQGIVISHDEVIANYIDNSELRVRNGIRTNSIRGNTRIFLGPSFLRDERYKKEVMNIENIERQLRQKEFLIEELQDQLKKEKFAILNYLKRLKEENKQHIFVDSTLLRLHNTLKATTVRLQKEIKDYERRLETFFAQKMYLSFYLRRIAPKKPIAIRVYGTLDAGTIITAPNQVVKISRPLKNVSIQLDNITGKLIIKHHETLKETPTANVKKTVNV